MFQSISDIGLPIVSNPPDADQGPGVRTLVTSLMTRHTPSQADKLSRKIYPRLDSITLSLFCCCYGCAAKADKLGLDFVFVTIKTLPDQSVLALILKLIWFLASQLFCELPSAISFI